MKPPPFRYVRATSLTQALSTLSENPGEAKVLAGGQSLMPLLNFRLLEPQVVLDINGLEELKGIVERPRHLRIGGLTRHHEIEVCPLVARHFPVMAAAVRHVAHLTIRNRGTLAGSIVHADPAAEMPLISVLLDARIEIAGPAGIRVVPACDFFVSALSTILRDDEIVTAIELPLLPQATAWAFEEVSRRKGDFALAAVGVTFAGNVGCLEDVRIALAGVAQAPFRATAAEASLAGQPLNDAAIAEAATLAAESCDPPGDLHASADFRRHLAAVLVRRCLTAAAGRLDAATATGKSA